MSDEKAREGLASAISIEFNVPYNEKLLGLVDAIQGRLAAAGLKVLAREPTEAMLSPHALDMATVHETHGMKNRCEQIWRAMWDDAK